MLNIFSKLYLIFFVLLFSFINLCGIHSQERKLEYTCILEQKEIDIELTKSILSTKVSEFLLGYVSGIEFNYSGYSVKLVTKGEISRIGQESNIKIKYKKNKTLLLESGVYKYVYPNIENYKEVYTFKTNGSGTDFWEIFRSLIIKSIKKKVKNGSRGIIVPSGRLNVKLHENSNISISEVFNIYVF